MVADASAVIEALLNPTAAGADLLLKQDELHAPDLLGVEVLQTLRGLLRGGKLTSGRAEQAVDDFGAMPLFRHPLAAHEERVWTLRDVASAYDASYVALAEALGFSLLSADRRLARAAAGLVDVVLWPT